MNFQGHERSRTLNNIDRISETMYDRDMITNRSCIILYNEQLATLSKALIKRKDTGMSLPVSEKNHGP